MVSRRSFIKISTTMMGGLAIGFPFCNANAQIETQDFEPNIWVSIGTDDSIEIVISRIEMGQGLRTTFAMLLAEELDADWSKVKVKTAPFDPKYGNQWSFASASTMMNYQIQREAGATARLMLIQAAAKKWNVGISDCYTEKSKVINKASKQSLTYGELAIEATKQSIPEKIAFKNAKDFKIIGKNIHQVHSSDVVLGKPVFGIDIQLSNMLYATVEHCPEFRGKIVSYDKEVVLQMPGVKSVVEIPTIEGFYFVNTAIAVVADSFWTAQQAKKMLNVKWEAGVHHAENTQTYKQQLREFVSNKGFQVHHKHGDAEKILADSKTNLSAIYETPFLAHTPLEMPNCTVHVQGDRCTIWAGTQDVGGIAGAVSEALKIPKENVTVNLQLIGGAFGRRIFQDFAIQAALIAKNLNAPVKLLWTREDDIQHDFYRPISCHALTATLDNTGKPKALIHRIASTPISANANASAIDNGVYEEETHGASHLAYAIPNRLCEYTPLECGVPRGYWRGVALSHTTFAVESFIDELAHLARKDPLAYRFSLMESEQLFPELPKHDIYIHPYKMERLKKVMTLASEKAEWNKKLVSGRAKGFACCAFHNSYVGMTAEVAVEENKIRTHKIIAAIDAGLVINPTAAEAQIQGAIIQGLSSALYGEITIKDGKVEQSNFNNYILLRIKESPKIEVYFVQNEEPPSSIGEIAVPTVAPAVANAVFNLTKKRLRSLPFRM